MLLMVPELTVDSIPARGSLGEPIAIPTGRQPINPTNDPLVSLGEWRIPTLDAYAEMEVLPPRVLKARSQVAVRLQVARKSLPKGFDLVVLDGYRTLAEQQALVDHYKTSSEFVASTSPDAMRPPHTTGGAVDVTLTRHGVPLALGTDYDAFGSAAQLEAFESGSDGLVRRLRRLLAHAMTGAGFARYSPEWWHWSYGDDVWAKQMGRATLYEVVELQPTSI